MISFAASPAHADERPPVRLELGACLAGEREAIEHAVRVELGGDPPSPEGDTIVVGVDCAPDGRDAGVVLDVRSPGNPRHYRYALDWRSQPEDARPRLIGLAVAEAVDASRIELTAIPEPPRVIIEHRPVPVAAESTRALALVAERRVFSADAGVDLLGVALIARQRLSTHVHAVADVAVEGATRLTSSGLVGVTAVSSAPSIAYRLGDRLHVEGEVGLRLGLVRTHGEALPNSELVGATQLRAWLGPEAALAAGVRLSSTIAASARIELGTTAVGATARDLGQPVAVIGGTWLSVGAGIAIAL